MKITIKSSDEISQVLIKLINSIHENIEYEQPTTDFTEIHSFINYIASRYSDKVTTLYINYLRSKSATENLDFQEIQDLKCKNKEFIIEESSLDLVASLLRPLVEIHLDLKLIELCKSKYQIDYNTSCMVLYMTALGDLNNLKKSVSKDFYNCEPKYYCKVFDELSISLNKLKQKLSNKNIPLLKSAKFKYKTIIENYNYSERLHLGFDYFMQYAILSKRIHFSYIAQRVSLSSTQHYNFAILYFVLIYQQILKLVNKEDNLIEEVKESIDLLFKISEKAMQGFNVGDYVLLDFGLAEITAIESLTYHIKYHISNIFKVNESDTLPRFAMGSKVNKEIAEAIKRKHYTPNEEIFNNQDFYNILQELKNAIIT